MRTTIELSDEQRARLLEVAARRGEKGFSKLIQEAVDDYLERCGSQHERIQQAMDALRNFPRNQTEDLEKAFRESRATWR